MPGSVIVAGARTRVGRLLGGHSTLSAPDLGAIAIAAALKAGGISAADVDALALGQVVQSGAGPNPRPPGCGECWASDVGSRGHDEQVLLSGMSTIALPDQWMATGQHETGGRWAMTDAPHLLEGAGVAPLCDGGGQGEALVLEVPAP